MIITIKLQQPTSKVAVRLSIMAPIGAAAYNVVVDGNTAAVTWGMMKPGELGIDAFNRISNDFSNMPGGWIPVAARPEQQIAVGATDDLFMRYEFIKVGDNWQAATAELATFLRGLATFRSLPASAPSALGVKLTDLNKFKRPTARQS